MKKNRMSVMIGFGLVLISLLLAAYRPYVRVAPAARAFASHVPVVVDAADRKFSYAAYHAAADVEAADLSAARWQAMGEFYEEQGMLTRDNFDYDQAAELSAARWQAMGEFYVKRASGINYAMDPVDLKLFDSTNRSPAMMAAGTGIVYAMDLVDSKLFDSRKSAAASTATASGGIVYAMDPVDLKLFNAAESSAALATHETGIVYAMDPVDLKLFNASETAGPALAVK